MKKLTLFLIIILSGLMILEAQPPQAMKYKAIAKDEWGVSLPNKDITLRFTILQGSEYGNPVYIETHQTLTNKFGLMDVDIGNGVSELGFFADIDWSAGIYFIKIEMDPQGGTNFRLGDDPHQLLSVPYALYAGSSGNFAETDPVFGSHVVSGINATDISNWNNKLETEVDGSITNEIQILSLIDNTLNLSLNGTPLGIDLSPYLDNTDAQQLSLNNQTLSLTNGGSVLLPEQTVSWNLDAENQNITNLADPVDDQDAATKIYVDALIEQLYASGVLKVGDFDGNYYNTIKIGNQIWMTENLKTTHYANGDIIFDGTGAGDISGENNPAYWFAYNDDLNNVSTYGRLYTWYTVADSRNVCPDGWHVPSDVEWSQLITFCGGPDGAGGKLKETGFLHWVSPNTGATNEFGFTALPGGYRHDIDIFQSIGDAGDWWTTYSLSNYAYYVSIIAQNDVASIGGGVDKSYGFSVRCVRD